jgi:Ser/Thr protein kinase RdoA (MazF antagonist)
MHDTPPPDLLAAWGLEEARCTPVGSGHINRTWRVEPARGEEVRILQRMSPIFGPELQEDIEAITSHLESAGLLTPRLVRTRTGALWTTDVRGAVWRLLTCVPGETLLSVDSPARCRAAGELLGRFHRALWDCPWRFRHRRFGVHDTPRHLARLRQALAEQRSHRHFAEVEPVAQGILEAASDLALPDGLPERVVHGDPKISNVIFGPRGEALCLVDLDTLARMPLAVELGDALRSWGSSRGEEVEGPLDLELCRAALAGYAAAIGDLPTAAEWRAIPAAVLLIAVELAARFCTDALEESYFGWDRQRFSSASEHNLVRARAQLSLQTLSDLSELERIAADVFADR